MSELTVAEIAGQVGGRVVGDGDRVIRGVATLESAGAHDLSLVASRKYLPYLGATRAGAVLVASALSDRVPEGVTRIVVSDAHAAMGEAIRALHPPRPHPAGIHPTAVVAEDVLVGADVSIGPYAVVEAGVVLGDRARIGPHAVIGAGSRIGADAVVHAHATLYPGVVLGARVILHSGTRIGSDGFGYAWTGSEHRKVPQVGGCIIGDDVEIGANSTVDRGSIGDTVVGTGAKIDNLVHLGHNVRVGAHAILIAQVGVAGSSKVGDGAILGGQAGVSGHVEIGAGARVGAQAGVTGNVPPGVTVSGYPARPHREALRAQAAAMKLPELLRRLQRLDQRSEPGDLPETASNSEPLDSNG
jgi:UDP-3-O-[3-hydroxymyristoyl] glucosamine N-acyltransferase